MASNTGEFKTFIFLDVETTGLVQPIEITELSLVAIQKRHLLAASKESLAANEIRMPRKVDKLQVCVRPQQPDGIEDQASRLTGISDEDLSELQPFDQGLALMIQLFCMRQPKPACLVAHHGDGYDFEIVASHFANVRYEFPSSILVSDSLKAFKDFYECMQESTQGVSFALSELYRREMDSPIDGRFTVEGDSTALIELILKNPGVLEYIQSGAHPLETERKNNERKVISREGGYIKPWKNA